MRPRGAGRGPRGCRRGDRRRRRPAGSGRHGDWQHHVAATARRRRSSGSTPTRLSVGGPASTTTTWHGKRDAIARRPRAVAAASGDPVALLRTVGSADLAAATGFRPGPPNGVPGAAGRRGLRRPRAARANACHRVPAPGGAAGPPVHLARSPAGARRPRPAPPARPRAAAGRGEAAPWPRSRCCAPQPRLLAEMTHPSTPSRRRSPVLHEFDSEDSEWSADGARLALGTLTGVPVPPPRTVDRSRGRDRDAAGSGRGAAVAAAAGLAVWLAGAALAPSAHRRRSPWPSWRWLRRTAPGRPGRHRRRAGRTAATGTRRLAVMRTGDVGPVGAAALVLTLLAQAAALVEVAHGSARAGPRSRRAPPSSVSRPPSPLACRAGVPGARAEGLGWRWRAPCRGRSRWRSWRVAAAAAWLVDGVPGLAGVPLAAAASVRPLAGRRRLGGVTGDVLGAVVELAFAGYLIAQAPPSAGRAGIDHQDPVVVRPPGRRGRRGCWWSPTAGRRGRRRRCASGRTRRRRSASGCRARSPSTSIRHSRSPCSAAIQSSPSG